MNADGSLISFSGGTERDAKTVAAIVSNIWVAYERHTGEGLASRGDVTCTTFSVSNMNNSRVNSNDSSNMNAAMHSNSDKYNINDINRTRSKNNDNYKNHTSDTLTLTTKSIHSSNNTSLNTQSSTYNASVINDDRRSKKVRTDDAIAHPDNHNVYNLNSTSSSTATGNGTGASANIVGPLGVPKDQEGLKHVMIMCEVGF